MELEKYEMNIKSQYGEDGVIKEIISRIGEGNKLCVEFGSWDGLHLSNTWNLWSNLGWNAILIEGDFERFKALERNTSHNKNVKVINEFVAIDGPNSLESILKRSTSINEIDLLSIDIDGDDYHIFSSLKNYHARVIVIEYNPTIPPHLSIVQEPGQYFGSSALALKELANKQGYKLAHLTETNLFFIHQSCFQLLEIEELNLKRAFKYEKLTTVITSFDGTEFLDKKPPFMWRLPFEKKAKGIRRFLSSRNKKHSTKPPFQSSQELIKVKIYKEE